MLPEDATIGVEGREWPRAIVWAIGPNALITIAYFVLLLVFFAFYGVRFQMHHVRLWSVSIPVLFVVYLTYTLARLAKRKKGTSLYMFFVKGCATFIADWFPFALLVTIYENLRDYTAVVRSQPIDAVLYKIDLLLFSVPPTIWIQKFVHPVLTEYFSFVYSLFLVLPMSLGWVLYGLHKRHAFHQLATSVIICMGLGFLLYVTFPAGPPRFYLAFDYPSRYLPGIWGLYDTMKTPLDGLNPLLFRSSFPSLHVAMPTVAVLRLIKLRAHLPFKKWFITIYSVFALSIWISTIYLRHHWVMDIVAGWVVAVISVLLSDLLMARIKYAPDLKNSA